MAAYKPFITESDSFSLTFDGPIVLREEQLEAVKLAKKQFGKTDKEGVFTIDPGSRKFLWNAKMRFGKTLCAMQLVKEMGVQRVLIVTHRPVVNEEWFDNFKKIFTRENGLADRYDYGTKSDKDHHGNYYDLERYVKSGKDNHYVFFASMQYLRRSSLVNGREDEDENQLKKDILQTNWDLVIIDEAHEGTRTALGQQVINLLKKASTKMLNLSGTPFNLYEDFSNGEIYTWDYIQEQQAKNTWNEKHPMERNPYAELPQMKIFTFDLSKLISNFVSEGGEFKFSEFFRTWTGNPKADKAEMPEGMKGRFIHEDSVKQFLDKLCEESETSNYPFSKENYIDTFNHTLWIVPGVKEAKALENLLHQHEIFSSFKILNVAGNGNDDEQREDALDKVKSAIMADPTQGYTITISCGRLTTGVTIREWTAVFYLKGSEMTSASTYMQTIFRVQSPWVIKDKNGNVTRMKQECYVFDFAPNRSLKMVAETAKFSSLTKKDTKKKADGEDITQDERDKATMREFLNLCPVLSLDGGSMVAFDENKLFGQLNTVYIDRLVLSGFDDNCLYDQEELMNMDAEALNLLGEKIGELPNMSKAKAVKKNSDLKINQLTEEQLRLIEEAKRKAKENRRNGRKEDADLTPEELAAREAWRKAREEAREERNRRISNIKGISLRVPLLMYGGADAGDPREDLTTENFTRKIKDESWAEFMPRGVTKQDFNAIRKCFNATRFEEAGKRYRALAREADEMHVEDRIHRIAEIFDCFKNPDKETVLTPWRVVNMHMSMTLGGYCFFNERFDGPNEKWLDKPENGELFESVVTNNPRFVNQGDVTHDVFGDSSSKILEINSKTGLYPLYVAYSIYRCRMTDFENADLIADIENYSVEEEQVVWDDILKENIFVICNTPMAKLITKRTLCGFREVNTVNIKDEKLIDRATTDQKSLIQDIKRSGYWRGTTSKEEMKFNAVVGNPPYQSMDGGGTGSSAVPLYHLFVDIAKSCNPDYVSMIMPAKWYSGGRGLDTFRQTMLNDLRISILVDFEDSRDCFPTVDIAGGVCYFLWNNKYNGKCAVTTIDNGRRRVDYRYLNEGDTFIRNVQTIDIIKKLKVNPNSSLSQKVYASKPFGLRSFDKGFQASPGRNVRLFGSDGISFLSESEVPQNVSLIPKWKVIMSKASAEHAGQSDKDGRKRIVSRLEVLTPGTICTESYLLLDVFDSESEAISLKKYIQTQFARFLLGSILLTQNIVRDKFRFIPLQDFTSSSDIDWSKSVAEIDQQLYRKYSLSSEEIDFIERMIKPME